MIENQELINPALDNLDFYLKSMSMAMNGSYGMRERCKIYFDILENVLKNSVDLYNRLDFFYFVSDSDNYFTKNEVDGSETSDYWLEFIASIFGLNRSINDPNVSEEEITLTNAELLIYIEATIARYNFNGSRESINEAYNGTNILFYPQYDMTDYSEAEQNILKSQYKESFLSQLGITYQTCGDLIGSLHMPVNSTVCGYDTPHLIDLFNAGYLTIESVGITYIRNVYDEVEDGVYDSAYYDYHDEIADKIVTRTVYKYQGEVTNKIYGVSWINDDSTTMTRTDDAVGMANPTFSSEYDSIDCFSPFDNVFPWNEATVETIGGNKMLHMPEMWFRVETDPNAPSEIVSVAVSKEEGDTGHWYNVKSFYYSCYGGSISDGILKSVSGVARADTMNRALFRNYATANGSGYTQLDLYHHTVMLFLWWIEFATKNPNSIANGMFRGVIKDSGAVGGTGYKNTGATDGLSTPTGIELTRYQMRWHYIEDFVGNKYNWVDGIVHGAANGPAYVTSDSSKYTDNSSYMSATSYNNPGSTGQCIMAFGWDSTKPFLMMPTRSVENSNWDTGFCEAANFAALNVLCVGASASSSDLRRGVCHFNYYAVSSPYAYVGARLIKSTL